MSEIVAKEIAETTEGSTASENFDPDKRIDVSETELYTKDTLDTKDFDPDSRLDSESKEVTEQDIVDYVNDLKEHSEYPETIPEKAFGIDDIERRTPEENGKKRANFQGHGEGGRNNPEYKGNLRNEWEKLYGKQWPRYTESNCPSIRNPGDCYDAHHIKPLGWGGESTASNITPMHADVHFDSRGIHDINSPYARIDNKLGGNGND